jgi:simple sugar transport system ATP-binding protein
VSELSVGQRQRVEILKALYRGAETLILDEPTGVLTPGEADHLFDVLRQLRSQGKTVVLITHKLREVMAVTDRVSVMRRGELVGTVDTKSTSPRTLAELMVGRSVRLTVEKAHRPPGRTILSVREVGLRDAEGIDLLRSISFDVREGEIVGIAGVAGNGQSELLDVLTGIRPRTAGEITVDGEEIGAVEADPHRMRCRHVAHVPEDRQKMGLVLPFAATENLILGYQSLSAYGRGPLLDWLAIASEAKAQFDAYDVRPPEPELRASLFSGGNQQKLVLAREFERDPKLLIIGQPTRGVDIGAIEFIHKRLIALRDRGKAILLVSVELDEIRALADRILVMFAGRIAGERPPDTDEHALGLLMAGAAAEDAAA